MESDCYSSIPWCYNWSTPSVTSNRELGMSSSSASSGVPQVVKLHNIISSHGQKFTSSFEDALLPLLDSSDNLPEPLWGQLCKSDCWIVFPTQCLLAINSMFPKLTVQRFATTKRFHSVSSESLKLIWNFCFFFALVHHWGRSVRLGIAVIFFFLS